jgi:hypothetical protein
MSGTPDQLFHMGGVPVASEGDFAGWWGNDVWFVDFDNGIRAISQGRGKMDRPQKDIYQAVTDAGPGDTIFMRPRTTVGTQGTNQSPITPALSEAANITIARTQHHLSVIGTRKHVGIQSGAPFLQGYAGVNTPFFKVLAPYVTFENLVFNQASAQLLGSIHAISGTPGTNDGFGCVIDHCGFHVHKSTSYGAVLFDSGRYNQCLNSNFWHCVVGINLGASAMAIQGAIIADNTFHGLDTDVDVDIEIASGGHLDIRGNRMLHAQPNYTTGAYKKYIAVVTAATGIVSGNYFGVDQANIDTLCSLGSMLDIANMSATDTGFCTNS